MPDSNKVVQALRAALAKMNDTGAHWIRGSLHERNEDGEDMYCSLGALMAVTGIDVPEVVRLSDDGVDISPVVENVGDVETRAAATLALSQAVPVEETYMEYAQENHVVKQWNTITHWNDARAASWDEVKEVFARAEEIAVEGVPAKEEA